MARERFVITGASRGIGRAIALRLASQERSLLVHGRDREALQVTADAVVERGGRATCLTADLSLPAQIESMVAAVGNDPVNGLINNAGMSVVKPVGEITMEEWQASLAINVTAPFVLSQRLLPLMPPGAVIVNIMSIAARVGFPGWSSYCACKFALEGFTQSLRGELRPRGIRVINVYPSATNTDIWNGVEGEWPREKMLDPSQVADAVAFAVERPHDVLVDTINVGNVAGTL